MIYEKRLLVLSGEGSGCLRLERTKTGIACRLTGSVRGECVLAVRLGGRLHTFGRFTLPPAYSFTLPPCDGMDDLVASVGDARGGYIMSGGFRRPMPWKGNLEDDLRRAARECGGGDAPKQDINDYFLDIVPQDYDDGKIAEVNYYRSNLTVPSASAETAASVTAEEQSRDADAPPPKPARSGQPARRAENSRPAERADSGEERSGSGGEYPLSDDDYGERKVPELGGATFYDSVSDQLDKLFSRCERFPALEKLLPDSRWVKVDYDGSGRYYLVGLIGDPVRYMCYGVPGEYSPEPPRELAGYCQWLAVDENDPAGKGFWLMYQDAATGKSIL